VSYTVQWSRRALESLAQIWLDYPNDHAAITEAVSTADRSLAINPFSIRESRENDRRILIVPPVVLNSSSD
jgi:hypothetical protein